MNAFPAERAMTAVEFDAWAALPEHLKVGVHVHLHRLGITAGADGGYQVGNYLNARTAVWVVAVDERRIEVYAPGAPVVLLRVGDTLDGGALLPGFRVAVAEVFGAV